MDKNLLRLVKDGVTDLKSQMELQKEQIATVRNDVTFIRDQESGRETRLNEQHKRSDTLKKELQQALENSSEETAKVLERLVFFEKQISIRLQVVEEGLVKTSEEVKLLKQSHAKTVAKVDQLDQRQTNAANEVELLKHSHTKTADEVDLLKHGHTQTADEVELLKHSHTKTADEVELLKQSQFEKVAKVDELSLSTQNGKPRK